MRLLSRSIAIAILAVTIRPARATPQDATPRADDAPAPKTLFERLGGIYILSAVVDDFVNGLYTDPVVNARPASKRALRAARKAGFKFQATSLLCQETGGPCKYDGRSMREAHADLGITAREWEAAAAAFRRALAKNAVPAAERQELLNLLGTTKGDIVKTAPK
jgi:hemoglobin